MDNLHYTGRVVLAGHWQVQPVMYKPLKLANPLNSIHWFVLRNKSNFILLIRETLGMHKNLNTKSTGYMLGQITRKYFKLECLEAWLVKYIELN